MNDLMERFDIVLLLIGDEAENADNDDQQGGDEVLILCHDIHLIAVCVLDQFIMMAAGIISNAIKHRLTPCIWQDI